MDTEERRRRLYCSKNDLILTDFYPLIPREFPSIGLYNILSLSSPSDLKEIIVQNTLLAHFPKYINIFIQHVVHVLDNWGPLKGEVAELTLLSFSEHIFRSCCILEQFPPGCLLTLYVFLIKT